MKLPNADQTRPESVEPILANPSSPRVWSCNEWDPLEEVIVGRAVYARYPTPDKSAHFVMFSRSKPEDVPAGPFDPRITEEAEEDLSALVDTLETEGIVVQRPHAADSAREYSTPTWRAQGFHTFCPRDVLTVVTDQIIETPNALRSRYFETFAYRGLLTEYFHAGARWIGAPKPVLDDAVYENKDGVPGGREPVFDAANVMRCGYDLFYLVSCSGNRVGAEWLRRVLGPPFRIHSIDNVYAGSHIDSTFVPLRPGLMLCNPARVNEKNLPRALKEWKVIFSPPMVHVGESDGREIGSEWIGMNLLSLGPTLAVVDSIQVPLIRLLETHGINVIPLRMRHARRLGGGFHCVTLDVRRRGGLEHYFERCKG